MSGLSLSFIQRAMKERRREWGSGPDPSLSYHGNQLAGETGELCNDLKKLERLRLGIVGGKDTTNNVPKEMADVIMCVALIANKMGIDLEKALQHKFNETSEKHDMSKRIAWNRTEGYHTYEMSQPDSPADTDLY